MLTASRHEARFGRFFSFGAGTQSMAVLVLQAEERLPVSPYEAFIFANVGDDSENPQTIAYLEQIAKPYAAAHGIEIVTVQATRFGEPVTLLQHLREQESSVPIPVWLPSGAPGRRSCTRDFKVAPVDGEVRRRGVTHVTLGLGISIDEAHRMKPGTFQPGHRAQYPRYWKRFDHPLIEAGLNRQAAIGVIQRAGLPVPPRSKCWFCPFGHPAYWEAMAPDLLKDAFELEDMLNERRTRLGRDAVYLHQSGKPLREAISGQMILPLEFEGEFEGELACSCEE